MARSLPAWIALGATLVTWGGAFGVRPLKPAPAPAGAQELTVSLAVEQPVISQPFPERVMLRFHNTGATPLWLYRHVRDPQDLAQARARMTEEAENTAGWSTGGSSLVIHLERAEPGAEWGEPPHGQVLASVGMPHPHLVSVAPGGEATEGAVLKLDPGVATREGHSDPVWGRYKLSVTYQASYSNGVALARDLGVELWQGEATSNAVDVDLEPALASAAGAISGRVANRDGRPVVEALVSLSDHENHVLNQIVTGLSGEFSFEHLPAGTYWVTARRPAATSETSIFDHTELGAGGAKSTVNLVLLDVEQNEPRQFLHKPVLIRVTSNTGQPLAGVQVETLKSSGELPDVVKGETGDDGAAALDLLPGRIYITLKRHKCRNLDTRIDVAPGDGIDGSILEMDCTGR